MKKTLPKKKPLPTNPGLRTNNIRGGEKIFDLADIILNFQRPEVCNLSLDELLDKMVDQGIDSLTEVEKKKLEEYSKSI